MPTHARDLTRTRRFFGVCSTHTIRRQRGGIKVGGGENSFMCGAAAIWTMTRSYSTNSSPPVVYVFTYPFNDAVSVNPADATNWDIAAFLHTRHASDLLSLEAGTSCHLP